MTSFDEFKNGYLAKSAEVLLEMRNAPLSPFVELVFRAQDRGTKLVFMGNGGMSSTATHFAMGLSYVSGKWQKPIRALSIAQDATVITSLANDWGYAEVFKRQLEVLLQPGDIVVALSVSGESANVVKAAEFARSQGHTVVGIVGTADSSLARLCDLAIHIPRSGSTHGITEDSAMILGHAVCHYLETLQQSQPRS